MWVCVVSAYMLASAGVPPPPRDSQRKQVLPCHVSADITTLAARFGRGTSGVGRKVFGGTGRHTEGTGDRARLVAIPESLCGGSLAVTMY